MPVNLLAVCGRPGDPTVKRVRVSANVQARLEGLFDALEVQFRLGIESERHYDSRWFPNPDELTTLPSNTEINSIRDTLRAGVMSLPELDTISFENENIRALAIDKSDNINTKIIFQSFSVQQRLSRRFAFFSKDNVFEKLDDPAFSLTNQIDMIFENDLIKFKTFNMAKRILDLSNNYKEASELEIREFCDSAIFKVNVDEILKSATQPIKKLISSIQDSGILENYTAKDIAKRASGLLNIEISKGKLVIPSNKRDLKDFLTLLDHGIYKSPIDDDAYETNSRRKRSS